MRISFFEEFPRDGCLEKLSLVTFPTTVFVAAESVSEFEEYVKKYAQKNVHFAWWPTLTMKQGYWLSPFVRGRLLQRVIEDSQHVKTLLWDAEFPKNRWLFFRWGGFFRKRRLIREFMREHGENVHTAEYALQGWWLTFFGLHFPEGKNKIVRMMYSSMLPLPEEARRAWIYELRERFGDRLVIGLGCIASGVLGFEKILSPDGLERDLEMCRDAGIQEVVIFRLGGLTKEYVKVLKNFL